MITNLTTLPRTSAAQGNQPAPSPAPAPAPAPAPQPAPDTFDLSTIDTPTEAMMMPGADLLASMVVGNFPSQNGVSHLESNGQTLEYTTKASQTGLQIDGNMNGGAFSLTSTIDQQAQQVHVTGNTPGGAVDETLEGIAGGVKLSGSQGQVKFDETFSLDPMAGLSGHVGDMDGNFGGQAFHQTINLAQDGQSLILAGNLGQSAITGTITQGQNGAVVIDRTIGGNTIHQTITPSQK